MKKNLLFKIMVLLFILLLCTSCSRNEKRSVESESREIMGIQTTMEYEASYDSKHYAMNENYGIALSILRNNDMPRPEENIRWISSLIINYPQLYNLDDYDKEKRINDMLFKQALNIRDINTRRYIEYNIDYTIMEANDEFISILFTGFVHDVSKYNSIAYAVTIDLHDERLMDLAEFFKIDNNLIKHLHKDFNVMENNFTNLNENDVYVKEYVERYNKTMHLHDFYINNEVLGLIIPAPQAMGYILLEGNVIRVR